MSSAASASRRYLALYFPFLSAERWRIANGASAAADVPLVFVTPVKGALRLAAVDRQARGLGLLPGLSRADAQARVPDLIVEEYDAEADARWLDRLCQGAMRYTPIATTVAPDALILDIAGCVHLFGGEAALAADAVARLTRIGMTPRHACGATAEAALALARLGEGIERDEAAAVRRLPVLALGLDPESELGLRRAGLKTVGDVAERPRAAIAARFGTDAVTALARLLGEERSAIGPRAVADMVHAERRFAEPVARTEFVIEILAELTQEAMAELRARGQGGRRFEALFFRSDGLARRLGVELGRSSRDADAVMRLFRERIDRLNDPLDPGFGFDMIRLSVPSDEALAPVQPGLDGEEGEAEQVTALIDRLTVRLGRGGLLRYHPRDTHIPEASQVARPAIEGTGAGWSRPEPGEPPLRPIRLFDPPERVTVIAEVPDGPPHRFEWRGHQHRIALVEGPERIASVWWRTPRDPLGQRRLTRDYYRVEDVEGRRYWLFRHGLYGREKVDPGWYLHGLFG